MDISSVITIFSTLITTLTAVVLIHSYNDITKTAWRDFLVNVVTKHYQKQAKPSVALESIIKQYNEEYEEDGKEIKAIADKYENGYLAYKKITIVLALFLILLGCVASICMYYFILWQTYADDVLIGYSMFVLVLIIGSLICLKFFERKVKKEITKEFCRLVVEAKEWEEEQARKEEQESKIWDDDIPF